jgi:oligopeptide/dipeptide ABC transporter ATP-binding protein
MLCVKGLNVWFPSLDGLVQPLHDIDFSLMPGEIRGVVGESGSGKSVLASSLLGLLEEPAIVRMDDFTFAGQNVLNAQGDMLADQLRQQTALISQDPLSSLDPRLTVRDHFLETFQAHDEGQEEVTTADEKIRPLLEQVGLGGDDSILLSYPAQLTAGVAQRLCIAIALAANPKLLIADEATTNLDVSVEAQIVDLLRALSRQREMSMIFITHDFSILKELTDTTAVFYCGRLVEEGPTSALLAEPYHPYTRALVDSALIPFDDGSRLKPVKVLPGHIPSLTDLPPGCPLGPRCSLAGPACSHMPGISRKGQRLWRCHAQPESHP